MFIQFLVFLVILSILVLVHELGHFIAARREGIWVEEFGFGIPPRVYGKKIGETIYSINLLPIGGFVRLHGENSEVNLSKPKRAFLNKSKKARIKVIVAGVFMNLALAIFIFSAIYSIKGIPKEIPTNEVKVVQVAAGSPAEGAGIIIGDLVTSVEGRKVVNTDEFSEEINKSLGETVEITVVRNSDNLTLSLVPRENPPEGEGAIGVAIQSSEVISYFPPIWQRPFLGIYYGFQEALFWGGAIIFGLASMFIKLLSGVVPTDVAGPVGLFAITSETSKQGFLALANLTAVISVNLAILNIVPFPALDGGRLLFLFLEKLFGRKILPKVESAIHAVGFAVLIILILLISFREVNIIRKAGLEGYLDQIIPQEAR